MKKDKITINSVLNENGNACLIIEGNPFDNRTIEFSNFNKFFFNLLKQTEETKISPNVNITLATRQELVCSRHELPEIYRQDKEPVFNIDKVDKSFKKEIKIIIFETQKLIQNENLNG